MSFAVHVKLKGHFYINLTPTHTHTHTHTHNTQHTQDNAGTRSCVAEVCSDAEETSRLL